VDIDDATRLVFIEILPDEKQATTVGFLLRAVAWFDTQGIPCKRVLSDNGSAYRSKPWREACIALSVTPKRTRPYTPGINGKAERFIQTLCREWAYGMPFQNSEERNRWLPCYQSIYNRLRKHTALYEKSPQQRLNELLC
jgi:transposase InsO family protein